MRRATIACNEVGRAWDLLVECSKRSLSSWHKSKMTCRGKRNLSMMSKYSLIGCSCPWKHVHTSWAAYFLSNIGWLIAYVFTSRSRIFHLYKDVTTAGEGQQNLGLSSALRAFDQGGIFIVPQLLWHGTSVFPVWFEGPPYSVASYDTQVYSTPDPHRSPISRLLRHTRGCGGTILTRILTGSGVAR